MNHCVTILPILCFLTLSPFSARVKFCRMTGGSFFQRVAARLIFSLLLLSLLFYLFFRRVRLWLNGIQNGQNAYFNRIFSLSERPLQRISNNCLITNFVPSKGTISGCPFTVETSCLSEGTCYVLTDVPTRSLHQALIGDQKKLQEFLSIGAIRCFRFQCGTGSFTIDLTDNFQQTQGKCSQRGRYSSVIALVSDTKPEDEQVVISCYVIHIRLSEEERFDTSILYTFWKTNWDRLLTPQMNQLFTTGRQIRPYCIGRGLWVLTDSVEHSKPNCQ
ncbi:hypothetical protein CRM22_010669 [Opisthorchis felineus]|uniref:Uncharacterized protein n=2 Tax=Opisthorchis felineus TaxID=147828 RepID=A0A4V3SBB1_OPIFE|nr:hypothetical protein CRM22_010669 [Opisthorchis felineus]